jgi:polyphosphate kinase
MSRPKEERSLPAALSIDRMESEIPEGGKPKRKRYELELMRLQIEMLKLQLWLKEGKERVVILFEGRDAAGKGGAIRRFTEHVNPRGARVVALPTPSDIERSQWYLQRYVAHLPAGGEIVFFDRSWYNRAGVERVMGYATPAQVDQFFEQVPDFERQIVESGIHLFKLWFTVSQAEQYRRFEDRRNDPLKRWKLSPNDEASIARFAEYGAARDEMFLRTNTPGAPWTVINSNVKRRARLESMRHVLHALPYPSKDESVVRMPDPRVVQPAAALFRRQAAP